MRIAMIGQKGIPARDGGVERHVHDLAMRLDKKRFEVIVYSRRWYTGNGIFAPEGVKIVNLPTIHTKHLDTILHTFVATLHALYSRVDVIHYHGVGPSLLSWIPRLLSPRTKVITTFHSMDRKHEKWGWFAKFMLKLGEYTACKFSHTLIAVSPTIEQYARDVYDKKAVYIPNAVEIHPVSENTQLLKQWNLEPQEYLLMVSRLIPHKGAHYLIEAWKHLKETKSALVHNKKLVIVGDGYYTDGYVEKLKHMAQNDDSIVFTGFQTGEPLRVLYSQALIQIHPSDNEGLPMCVLEGMSYHLPLLLSDIPEHKDLNRDYETLFHYGSVKDLEEKLISLLSLSKEELKQKGEMNFSMIQKYYSLEKVIEQVVETYEEYEVVQPTKRPSAFSI